MRRILTISLLALLAAAPAAQGFPGRNGRIAYGWSTLDEPELGPPFTYTSGILAIKAGGGRASTLSQCVRVTGRADAGDCAATEQRDPSWSPDGTRIVLDAGPRLALLDASGGGLRLLPAAGGDAGQPVFSPSGARVAFVVAPEGAGAEAAMGEIWTSDLAGGRARRVTGGPVASPSWSVKGPIAFERRGQIWTVREGGTGLRQLTRRGGTAPAWSPHGTKLAFLRRGTVHVMGADGRRLKALRTLTGVEQVRWSPDGKRLVVEQPEAGISIANADGSGLRMIVQDASGGTYNQAARGVDWQPLR